MTSGHQAQTDGAALELAQLDEAVGGLTKVGVGTLTLSSANTYTGQTVVQEGVLRAA
jgi:autotransporter-associated beta strand protein